MEKHTNIFNFKSYGLGLAVKAEFSKRNGALMSFEIFDEKALTDIPYHKLIEDKAKKDTYSCVILIDEESLDNQKEISAVSVFNRDKQTVEDFFLTTYVDGDFFEILGDKLSNFDEYTEKDKDKIFNQQYERNGVYTISFLKYEH